MIKKLHISLALFFCSLTVLPQQGEWEWLKGNNGSNISGVYGTQGVAAPSNNPGSRESSVSWTDANGNFWLFGGVGFTGPLGYLNDLWKYDPTTNQWTWMRGGNTINLNGVYGTMGVSSMTNDPGARSAGIGWADNNGNLWLYGGQGYGASGGSGYLADLWRYNIATNIWTWVRGSNVVDQNGAYGTLGVPSATNNPGSRWAGYGWFQNNGSLWLFGGEGFPASGGLGRLNDLWRYNIATNEWTWIKGSNNSNQNGIYGSQGVPAPTNNPGGRNYGGAWKDFSGNFWLIGGFAFPISGGANVMNDVWRYNVSTNEWTWMKGSSNIFQNGIYGVIGVPNSNNTPGSRYAPVVWVDPSEKVWLFGGNGMPVSGGMGRLNDQWTYDMSTNLWTWIKGSQLIEQNGTYGTQGIPAPGNISGGRRYGSGWVDYCGNLYLFGGVGLAGATSGYLNDLWKYNNVAAPPTPTNVTPAGNQTVCSGITATLMALPIITGSVNWFATPTSTLTLGTGTSFVTPTLSTGNYTYYAEAYTCTNSINRTAVTLTVFPSPTISATGGTICLGQSFTISPSGAQTYTYFLNGPVVSPTVNTFYSVIGTSSLGCAGTNTALITVSVNPLPTISVNSGSICSGYNFTLNPSGASSYTFSGGSNIVSPTVTTSYSVTGSSSLGCISSSPAISNVTVLSSPVMSVSSGSICLGQSFTMVPSGAPSYTFSNGFAVVNPTVTANYSVTGTGTNGCVSPSPAVSTVTVIQPPVISVSGGSVCLGSSFTLSPSGASTYTYSSGTPVVSPTANTVYSVTGTSSLGCNNFTPVVCEVTVMPVPTVTASVSPTFICVGETCTLTAGGANSYVWSTGGIAATETVSPNSTSSYTVTGTDINGCTGNAVATVSVDLCTGVDRNKNSSENEPFFYPNPARDHIIFDHLPKGGTQITLYDKLGRHVMTVRTEESDKVTIDIRELPYGTYSAVLISKDTVRTYRLIRIE